MTEIIHCFDHIIEIKENSYIYTFAVPADNPNQIAIRKVEVGFVETQPIFQHIPFGRGVDKNEFNRWFKNQ